MRYIYIVIVVLFSAGSSIGQDVKITDLFIGNSERAGAFKWGETIDVYIEYDIQTTASVLLLATPYTNGVPTDDYLPTGTGTVSGSGYVFRSFSIPSSSSSTVIDEVRIRAVGIGGFPVYHDFYVPVEFNIGHIHVHLEDLESYRNACFFAGEGHEVVLYQEDTQLAPIWTGVRAFSQGIAVSEYNSTVLWGWDYVLREFEPLVSTLESIHVDELRIYYGYTADIEGQRYFSVPVNWLWSPVVVRNVTMPTSQWPIEGISLTAEYDYEVAEGVNALIYPRPVTEGGNTPNATSPVSPVYTQSGSSSTSFRVISGNQRVDGLRFSFSNADGSGSLGSIVFPTEHIFGDVFVDDLQVQPPSPARIPSSSEFVYYDLDFFNRGDYNMEVSIEPDNSPFEGTAPFGIPAFGFGYQLVGEFKMTEEYGQVNSLRIRCTNGADEEVADIGYPVDYVFADNYVSACGSDAEPLSAPVGLTKSFQPVPYPNGNVDRVQVKWYKELPNVKYQVGDNVACDIQFWPVKDLANDIFITDADSLMMVNVTKENKPLFKWPIKFRKAEGNNSKVVEPSTRYKWRVRCACNDGEGEESEWSEIKFFNTPAFDPVTGIYTAPEGRYLSERGEVKTKGQETLEFRAFPNPVKTELTIQSLQGISIERIEVLDITGRTVMEMQGIGEKQIQYRLNLASLTTGLYLARVTAGKMEQIILFEKI